MARFYGNENFDLQAADALRQKGHDVLTAKSAGKANQRIPDDEVLQFSTFEKRAVLTFNRKDFFKLHRQFPNHCGIVACTYDADFEALAHRIDFAVEAAGGKLDGEILRIYRPKL